jgi:ParB-like chromosome segregation protein Spo0J
MVKYINKVKEIDVATVEGNKILAAGIDRRVLRRCKEAIEKLGILHTPVVGATKSGNHLLLYGQCELSALRELGVRKMDAALIDVSGDDKSSAKLALLLMSLQEKPGALCEGLLIQEAVNIGISRGEIQTILGKSASWICNRLSLVTRLDGNVYELVRNGLIEPRSAQEIARLPAEAQFAFAEIAVREGLPKSAIESLVAGYNNEDCPDAVKSQMLIDPRMALKRMTDTRRAIIIDHKDSSPDSSRPHDTPIRIKATISYIATLYSMLCRKTIEEISEYADLLKVLRTEMMALAGIISKLISPGKTEENHGR